VSTTQDRLTATVTLSQAKSLIKSMAHDQSLLLLAPPGVGKSDTVFQAAQEAGLPCRSLLGTQIAPEDVSGIPHIVGERAVFCPPRVLLPEMQTPFCLFLDELPACAPDVQKAFYSLLLERRLGEHELPKGTWVVAAGNRAEDRAYVRALSSALINRVILLHVDIDLHEWLSWAESHGIRDDVRSFVAQEPESLLRPVPPTPTPFSTPRAWSSLSRALDLADAACILDPFLQQVLAFGRLSPEDAWRFCVRYSGGRLGPDRIRYLSRMLARRVETLNLSIRAVNCLESENIDTLADLVIRTEDELIEIRHFNDQLLQQVKTALSAIGLHLGMRA
jgi:Bacterial RNA polymerase, alpha chain C terminal domain/AAA domain (dynein-related subfamily)